MNTQNTSNKDNNIPDDSLSFGDSEEEDVSNVPQYGTIEEAVFAVVTLLDAGGNRNITFTEVVDYIVSMEDTSKPSLLSANGFPIMVSVWKNLHKKYGKGDVFRKGEIQALTVRIQEARRKGRDSDVKDREKLSKEFKNTDEKEETKKAINKDNELEMKEAQIQEDYRPYKDAPKSVFFDFIKENYKDIIYIIFFITIIASGILTAIGVFDKDKNLLYNIFYIILGFFAGVISSIFILSIIYYTIKECIPLLLRSMTNRKTSDDDENLKQLELASFLFFLPINFILSSVLFGNKIIIIVFVLWWTGIYWVFYFIKEKIKEYHSIDSLTDVAINKLSFIAFFFIALIIVAYGYEMYINIDEDIIYGFFSILTLVTLYYTYNFNPFRTDK